MCEKGSVYMPCGPPCEQTCRNLGDDPEPYCEDMHCLEGCFCPAGMVREGKYFAFTQLIIIKYANIATNFQGKHAFLLMNVHVIMKVLNTLQELCLTSIVRTGK